MAALTPPGGLARPLSAQVADPAGYETRGEASVRGAQHARWGLPAAAPRGEGSSRLTAAPQPMETAGSSRRPAARSGVMPGAMQGQAWPQAAGAGCNRSHEAPWNPRPICVRPAPHPCPPFGHLPSRRAAPLLPTLLALAVAHSLPSHRCPTPGCAGHSLPPNLPPAPPPPTASRCFSPRPS